MQIDTVKLRKAVSSFEFYSRPSDGCGNNPATVNDIRKVVQNTAKVLYVFINELENQNG